MDYNIFGGLHSGFLIEGKYHMGCCIRQPVTVERVMDFAGVV